MNSTLPLLIFDTNILIDLWTQRDEGTATTLVSLANTKAEILVPEFVREEFRGTAHTWIKAERRRVELFEKNIASWKRPALLSAFADGMSEATENAKKSIGILNANIDVIYHSIPTFARIVPHTQAAHLKGELRYLSGRAPDGPLKGLKDCRIYEAVLEIAHGDHLNKRDRYFVTKDKDFRKESLIDELALLGVTLEHEVGKLYAALR
jgi:predicted nucleic acid-binding protein